MSTLINTDLAKKHAPISSVIEEVLMSGDLSKLTVPERLSYYKAVCESLALNPLTRPFDYITLNNKLTLYAKRDCTDQIRNSKDISIVITAREVLSDVYVVTARATTPKGRTDESTGAVNIKSLQGEFLANAMMKAETKAKRRVTLSIAGLGLLDETEVDTIPGAKLGDGGGAPTVKAEPEVSPSSASLPPQTIKEKKKPSSALVPEELFEA